MKRKGFTLIELIFVIVIIGVLAAVAVPKFQNLKQNAEANNVYKVLTDAAYSAPSSYQNLVALEEKYDDTNVTLENLVQIEGKNWSYTDGTPGTSSNNAGTYEYKEGTSTNVIASLTLDTANHQVKYKLDCDNFGDTKTKEKCKKILNSDGSESSIENNVSW